MGFAVSALGWSEAAFWAATPHTLFAAADFRSGASAEAEKRRDFRRFAEDVSVKANDP